MITLPADLVLMKNSPAQTPWFVLLDITLVNPIDSEDTQVIRVVNNSENVSYQSNTYQKYIFELEAREQLSNGQLPELRLRLSNAVQTLSAYFLTYGGGLGGTVKITVVQADNLTEVVSELEETYDILSSMKTNDWVELSLGLPSPLKRKFPKDVYNPYSCQWKFKSCECGYTGETFTTCNRTLSHCRARGQLLNFGGFLGLRAGGLKIALG